MLLKTVTENLKRQRLGAGLTQSYVAEKISLGTRQYQKMESGETDIKLSAIEKISDVMAVPKCYLLCDQRKSLLNKVGIFCETELLDFLPMGVQVNDCEGRILYVNKVHRDLTGVHPEKREIFIWDFLGSDDEKRQLKEYLQFLLKAKPTPTPYFTRSLVYPGSSGPMKFDWNYLEDDQGKTLGFVSLISTHPCW